MNVNNISSIGHYSNKNLFKGNKEVSAPGFYPKKPENMSTYEFRSNFRELFLDSLNGIKEDLYECLDTAELEDGTTILQQLRNMFEESDPAMEEHSFYHKTYSENFEEIEKYGFSPSKIEKTEFGPGFYFGFNEGCLTIYSGVTCKATYLGKTAKSKSLKDYNKINSAAICMLKDFLKLPTDYSSPTFWEENEALRKFVNEYSRNKIVNDLGIDGTAINSEGYFIVFNPDAIKSFELLRFGF